MDEDVLKALCEPKRFLLLKLMAQRGYCVGALALKSGLSESAVSQHLKVLREAGLVYGVKRGYYTHYSLDKDMLSEVINELEAIRNTQPQSCNSPFYGCSEAEKVKCKAYLNSEEERKD